MALNRLQLTVLPKGNDVAKFMAKSDAELGATMKAVGLVK